MRAASLVAAALPVLAVLASCASPAPEPTGLDPNSATPPVTLARHQRAVEEEQERGRDAAPPPESSSRVVAYVNGEVVTYRDVLLRISPQLQVLADESQKAALEQKTVLGLVRDRVIDSAAREAGVAVRRAELENAINRKRKEIESSGGTLEAFLHERQMTERENEEQVRQEMRIQKFMLAAIGRGGGVRVRTMTDTFVSPAEAREYYERHLERYARPATARYRMLPIVIDLAAEDLEEAADQARRAAEGYRRRLAGGEDWVPVFREAMQGVEDAPPNDGLAEIARGEVSEWIEEFAFGSEKGTLSPVERKSKTFYLLYSEGSTPAHTVPYEEIQEEVRITLQRNKRWVATYEVELELLEAASIQPDALRKRLARTLREERRKVIEDLGR